MKAEADQTLYEKNNAKATAGDAARADAKSNAGPRVNSLDTTAALGKGSFGTGGKKLAADTVDADLIANIKAGQYGKRMDSVAPIKGDPNRPAPVAEVKAPAAKKAQKVAPANPQSFASKANEAAKSGSPAAAAVKAEKKAAAPKADGAKSYAEQANEKAKKEQAKKDSLWK